VATIDHLLSRGLSSGAPNTSLSVEGKAKIGNSLDSARLAVFTRSISFALAGHSADHNVCSFLWQAAQRLRGAGDIPAYVSILWLLP
jgi:hypothetical protein